MGDSRLNGAPASRVRLRLDLAQAQRDLAALRVQHVAVDQHAVALHALQHRHQRLLDLLVQPRERRRLLELRPQHPMQPQRDVGVLGRVFGGALDARPG